MSVEQFYSVIGGDYGETIKRLVTEERILRFVRKFPADGSYAELKRALKEGLTEEAFRAAHTLKGVAQNLGFTALHKKASAVTEVLRGGSLDVADLMPELDETYELTVNSIAALQ